MQIKLISKKIVRTDINIFFFLTFKNPFLTWPSKDIGKTPITFAKVKKGLAAVKTLLSMLSGQEVKQNWN